MKRYRKQTATIIAVILTLTLAVQTHALAVSVGDQEITSKGACIIDFDTGIMLYGYKEDILLVPASMIKLVAVYVIYDAIRAGQISMNTVTHVSKNVSTLSKNTDYANIPLKEGSAITIRELIDLTIIRSVCCAPPALGEALCGSEKAFIELMNDKIVHLGIEGQIFDSYGVSAKNKISPRGMAKLARYLILNHPDVLATASKRSVTFRGKPYENVNPLLGDYSGVDGIKTGWTNDAGFCITSTAKKGDCRIIAVTMGSKSRDDRKQDAKILLDYGFAKASSAIAEFRQSSRAVPSSANLRLNGVDMPLDAYLIKGNHYFRLRDIASLLSGTSSKFDVAWNGEKKFVSISSGMIYADTGDPLPAINGAPRQHIPATARFFIDSVEYAPDVYSIEGNNYFKLRDLAALIGFEVDWDEPTRTIIITTSEPKPEPKPAEAIAPDDNAQIDVERQPSSHVA